MADCCCGNPEGQNAECERCRLITRISTLEAEFDESKDAPDRASAFFKSLVALMKTHHVKVGGALNECWFEHLHGNYQHCWQVDMCEVQKMTDRKSR